MFIAIILVFIGGTIFSLWCSNERRILQEKVQHPSFDAVEEPQQDCIEQFSVVKSHS